MPQFEGFTVLDARQQMPAWRDTLVCVWTGMALREADDSRLALSARATLRSTTYTHVALP